MAKTKTRVIIVDKTEGERMLDEEAQRYLHISGEEFIRRWDAGEYQTDGDRPDVIRVAMLLPFAG